MRKKILITGGAGFVGSQIAISFKRSYEDVDVVAFDNLHRNGSELNIPRLKALGIEFVKGDVRSKNDLEDLGDISFLVECSAEPSVLAGKDGDTSYLIDTNLSGAVNCAEKCRKCDAPMIFLSTSRVYPIKPLLESAVSEAPTRLELSPEQNVSGLSDSGVSEGFPMKGPRSLYGGTKYAAEIMLAEFADAFDLPIVINRCGVLAGAWQFGKADQGIAAFWTAAHMFEQPLKYIGFGGSGKQVRDILNINDLLNLLHLQHDDPARFAEAGPMNVGGGLEHSVSLLELTDICRTVTGKSVTITPHPETRYADIPVYITDNSAITTFCGWHPKTSVEQTIVEICDLINATPGARKLFNKL
jgi:CDP-paratose 2-epimerase